MLITVNPRCAISVQEQIIRQIQLNVLAGALIEGQQLPSVRDMADRLNVNQNTVLKAYAALNNIGVTYARKGTGCFIHEDGHIKSIEYMGELWRKQLHMMAREMQSGGYLPDYGKSILENGFDFESEEQIYQG